MADERLRALARRAHETQAPQDRARWIRARLQAGALTTTRVELAQYAGDRASSLVLGLRLHSTPRSCRTRLEAFVRGLAQWGPGPGMRTTITAAEVAVPAWWRAHGMTPDPRGWRHGLWVAEDAHELPPPLPPPGTDLLGARFRSLVQPARVVDAARAWVDCQCSPHMEVWRDVQGAGFPTGLPEWCPRVHDWEITQGGRRDGRTNHVQRVNAAATTAGIERVERACRVELIRWCLGG